MQRLLLELARALVLRETELAGTPGRDRGCVGAFSFVQIDSTRCGRRQTGGIGAVELKVTVREGTPRRRFAGASTAEIDSALTPTAAD